ncbi:hypothetical protein [Kineosporia sp. R_H_3]|uniref:hypothetical protein n=1 Tax=Kineosporia sp. R_H_3 TaxID=1961848 RepID=UPI000B4AF76F|nr:hypothetical protein [Kineosporia sp. R_H_3]
MDGVLALAGWLERRLVLLVLGVGTLGVAVPGLPRAVADVDGISIALALLVFSVGLGVDPGGLFPPRALLGRCLVVTVGAAAVLPLLAWSCSRLVDDPALRGGVLSAGVAPAEVASVALVALAGGPATAAMTVLIGSTLLSVLIAGPALSALARGASADPASILGGLLLVVALPLLVGVGVRALLRDRPGPAQASQTGSLVLVLLLAWLVAGQIELSRQYLMVAAALLLFLVGSTALGLLLSAGLPAPEQVALTLPVGMRDFAIAAGIATQAFGDAAAAPLGLYGLLVLLLGAAAAARSGTHAATGAAHP